MNVEDRKITQGFDLRTIEALPVALAFKTLSWVHRKAVTDENPTAVRPTNLADREDFFIP